MLCVRCCYDTNYYPSIQYNKTKASQLFDNADDAFAFDNAFVFDNADDEFAFDNAFVLNFDNADDAFAFDNALPGLTNIGDTFAFEFDHAFMPHFDHALKVAHVFAKN